MAIVLAGVCSYHPENCPRMRSTFLNASVDSGKSSGGNNYDFQSTSSKCGEIFSTTTIIMKLLWDFYLFAVLLMLCLPINFVELFPQIETPFKAFCNELNYIIQNQYRRRPSNLQWWQQLELIHHVNARVRVSSPSLWHPNRFIFNQLIHYGRFRWRWMEATSIHQQFCFFHGNFGIGQSSAVIFLWSWSYFFSKLKNVSKKSLYKIALRFVSEIFQLKLKILRHSDKQTNKLW